MPSTSGVQGLIDSEDEGAFIMFLGTSRWTHVVYGRTKILNFSQIATTRLHVDSFHMNSASLKNSSNEVYTVKCYVLLTVHLKTSLQ
jgi:hypothetical protein